MLGRATSPTLLDALRTAGIRSVAVTASGPLLAPDIDEVDASAKPDEMTHRMHRYADRVTSAASKQLDRLMAERQPFLLLVHYMAPHAPYVGSGSRFVSARDRYQDEVAYVDAEMAPLLERLGERASAGELSVLVVSDHGEEFLEHGYGTHGVRLYDESMRVVLFAAGPGISPGESLDPVSGADLAPTLAALFGVDASEMAPSNQARTKEDARVIMMRGANSFGCVRGNVKWIHDTETGCWERYDLAADPNELHNGADEHAVPAWCATQGG
jgi:arylsulfatase A-like enzyme